MEKAELLRFNVFGEPDRVISRGHGHGVSPITERFVRTGRGFPEGLIEAWANLYTEFAMAVAARADERQYPEGWLSLPSLADGEAGVRFIHATVRSHDADGAWQQL